MHVVAIVCVRNPRVFSWLGHMPLLSWCVDKLSEARGISRVACVASGDLCAQASKILGIEATRIPQSLKTDQQLRAWVASEGGPAEGADVVLLLDPVAPFVPAAKLEACVRHAARKGVAMLGRLAPAGYVRKGAYDETASYLPMPSVIAYRPGAIADPRWRASIAVIEVGAVQALDATDDDGWQLASAAVAVGNS